MRQLFAAGSGGTISTTGGIIGSLPPVIEPVIEKAAGGLLSSVLSGVAKVGAFMEKNKVLSAGILNGIQGAFSPDKLDIAQESEQAKIRGQERAFGGLNANIPGSARDTTFRRSSGVPVYQEGSSVLARRGIPQPGVA